PRGQVEGEGDGGELPRVVDGEGRGGGLEAREGGEGHQAAPVALDVDGAQAGRVLPELGRRLQHHVVLVERGVHRGDRALSEGVVQRRVDGLRGDPHPRRGGAVDGEGGLQAAVL